MPGTKKKGRKGRKKKEASLEIPSDKYEFERQEYILCLHHGQLYKAKVLKRTINTTANEEALYYVHYHGWNQQWDEWVSSDRCYKNTSQNIEKQTQMKLTALAAEKMSNNNNNNSHNNNSNNNNSNNNFDDNIINKKKKNKKRQIEDSEEDESDNNNEFFQALVTKKNKLKRKDIDDLDLNKKIIIIENKKRKLNNFSNINVINNNNSNNNNNLMYDKNKLKEKLKTIVIPILLKDNLVEQYNLIHYDKKVLKLPKENGYNINNILNDCLMEQKNKLLEKEREIPQNIDAIAPLKTIITILPYVNRGIKGFFKNTLARNLLYNFEKPQLEHIEILNDCNNNFDLCDIYGSEHLIRLFYILPNILLHTKGINENNFGEIKQCISIIIQFINKNKTKYLIDYNQIENIQKYAQSVNDQYIIKANKIAKKYNQRNQNNNNNNDI